MKQLPLWDTPHEVRSSPPPRIFGLADANAFYVACERVFDATITHRPVIVLGNGDHCVVAVSREAKALGIKRGMPLFHYHALIEQYHIAVFSSNYALYQDMSERLMRLLARYTPRLEVFSIDEAFLDLSHLPTEHLLSYGQGLCHEVERWTGLPLSLGIGPSKVLAKLGSEIVKRQRISQGVFNFMGMPPDHIDDLLSQVLVEELFGIGERLASRLNKVGILTARTLKTVDHAWLRHLFGVGVQRVALELRGISCLPLQTQVKPRQAMMVSLSFSRPIERLEELLEAISHYSVRAGEKVRQHHQQARHVAIFIRTNPFDTRAAQYAAGAQMRFSFPTSSTPDIIQAAQQLVRQVYREGYRYKKAGVSLSDLHPEEVIQPDLFGAFSWEKEVQQAYVMALIDQINERWGRDTLFFAAQGIQRDWLMRQRRRSPHFTTNWHDVLTVGEEQEKRPHQ